MVQRLSVEIKVPKSEDWIALNDVKVGDRDGSLSDNQPDGRNVYIFGVDPIENLGYIKKSELGVDTEQADARVVSSLGFVTIAALAHQESFELTVLPDRSPEPRHLRFTYFED